MKTVLILIMSLLVFFSCVQRSNKTGVKEDTKQRHIEKRESGKSRIERVEDMSHRTISVPESLKTKLISDGKNIFELAYPLDSIKMQLFKIKDNNVIEQVDVSSLSIADLRTKSYGLWRNKDFKSTALIYQSATQDATSGREIPIKIIEFEYDGLSGTCFLFIPNRNRWNSDEIEFTYVERN